METSSATAPRRLPGRLAWVLLGALAVTLARPPLLATASQAKGGVACENRTAATDALSVLLRGGSAVDAAITAALVAGVVAPSSSGLGGGGFALVWDAAIKGASVLDFRETAPAGAEREPLERRPLLRAELGHLVGVPGEARGLYDLHQRFGKLPWAELVRVAERRARTGFSVSPFLGSALAREQAKVAGQPGFAFFYPGGKAALAGTRLTNPALADTLGELAAKGPDAFYQGERAQELIATVRAHGGTMTLADLAAYRSKEREPLSLRYGGADVFTMPPPSAGGLMLAQILSLFSPEELQKLGHGTPAYQHMLAEGMRGAVVDRMRYLSDPDLSDVQIAELLAPQRLERRRQLLTVDRTHALPSFPLDEQGTHAIVAADRNGNVISLTTTVNRAFGTGLLVERSGVLLNDELDDFSTAAGAATFGLRDTPNRLRPLARPVSSMTPTIAVKDGRVVLALGGSGGPRIATNVTQAFLSAFVFEHTAAHAVLAPRLSIPLGGASLRLEGPASELHLRDLAWRGEVVDVGARDYSAVQMMRFTAGQIDAAADPRKQGGVAIE